MFMARQLASTDASVAALRRLRSLLKLGSCLQIAGSFVKVGYSFGLYIYNRRSTAIYDVLMSLFSPFYFFLFLAVVRAMISIGLEQLESMNSLSTCVERRLTTHTQHSAFLQAGRSWGDLELT